MEKATSQRIFGKTPGQLQPIFSDIRQWNQPLDPATSAAQGGYFPWRRLVYLLHLLPSPAGSRPTCGWRRSLKSPHEAG